MLRLYVKVYRYSSEPDLRGELLASSAEETFSGNARRRFGAKRQNEKRRSMLRLYNKGSAESSSETTAISLLQWLCRRYCQWSDLLPLDSIVLSGPAHAR